MPNKKVGWGDEGTPTKIDQAASVGVPASPQPTCWTTAQLGELGTVVTGKTPSTKDPANFGGDIPFIKPGDLDKGGRISDATDTLSEKGFRLIPQLPKNTIMVTCIGNLGKVGLTARPSATNQQINSVTPYEGINFSYLYHYLRSMKWWLEQESSATTVAIINKGKFSKAPVLIPPLAEQKQIAAKLDELLMQVDSIKTRLDAIPAILKRFRQSVLAAAVSGRLTEEWWELTDKPAPWETLRIEQVAGKKKYSLGIGPFGSNLKVVDYRTSGHPLVFVREIRAEEFGGNKTKFISSDKFGELKAHHAKPGNILITKMGDPPGDVAIYPETKPEAVITSDCIKLDVDEAVAINKFVYYSMKSESFRNQVLGISAGVAQQKVNLKKFKKLELKIPSLAEQTQITHRVEQLFTFADQIEQRVKEAQSRVNHLTQSILAKAFRGELTAEWREQHPELISGEHSAEALLARIKTERQSVSSPKRTRKKRA